MFDALAGEVRKEKQRRLKPCESVRQKEMRYVGIAYLSAIHVDT
jgi:hypothetical protein